MVNIIPVDFPLKTKQRGYQWDFLQFKNFVNKEQELLLNGYEDIAGGNTKSFNAKMVERRCESFIIKNLFFRLNAVRDGVVQHLVQMDTYILVKEWWERISIVLVIIKREFMKKK